MDGFVKIFKALSDENRVRILKMLEFKPLCVCEIPEILGLSISTVSSHLTKLKNAGLISSEQKGKWTEYYLNKHSENSVLHQILAMLPGWLNDDQIVKNDIEKIKSSKIKCIY